MSVFSGSAGRPIITLWVASSNCQGIAASGRALVAAPTYAVNFVIFFVAGTGGGLRRCGSESIDVIRRTVSAYTNRFALVNSARYGWIRQLSSFSLCCRYCRIHFSTLGVQDRHSLATIYYMLTTVLFLLFKYFENVFSPFHLLVSLCVKNVGLCMVFNIFLSVCMFVAVSKLRKKVKSVSAHVGIDSISEIFCFCMHCSCIFILKMLATQHIFQYSRSLSVSGCKGCRNKAIHYENRKSWSYLQVKSACSILHRLIFFQINQFFRKSMDQACVNRKLKQIVFLFLPCFCDLNILF